MKRPIAILFLFLALRVFSQEPDHFIRGSFNAVPLGTFIREAEQQAGLRFFYRDEWIENITVTAEGDSLSLREVLTGSLKSSDIYYYIDTLNTVILTKGMALITSLAGTELSDAVLDHYASNGRNGLVTETEKSYIEGRKKIKAETIVLGDPNSMKQGKPVSVRGRMTDKESGEPLIGATAYVRETRQGYATDFDGQFLITLPAGTYDVVFNCLGMEEINYYLTLNADGPLAIEMNRKLIPLDEVKITADRFHNVRGTQMGYEHITLKTMKEIPVVMGERDVLKVAQMLPGVQTMGEGTSGFNVRGSAADQNMFFINKTPVYNTAHLLGFFSAFNPDLVKDFTLYKSNIPARYGGRLSSIFILNSPRGNKKKLTARGGISPITGHLMVEGPLKKEKHSFILAARSTYSDWLLSQLDNPGLRNSHAAFYDLAGHLNLEPDEKNTIRIFGYYSHDKFSLSAQNQHFLYDNKGASADWKHQLAAAGLLYTATNQASAIGGGDVTLVVGGGNGTTIDSDQPEFIIGVDSGYYLIPIEVDVTGDMDADADGEYGSILVFADRTNAPPTTNASGTAITPVSLLDGGSAFPGRCWGGSTGDITDPVVSELLGYEYYNTADNGTAASALPQHLVFHKEFGYPRILAGPCQLVICWGGTAAVNGLCSVVVAAVPTSYFPLS